MMVCVNISNIFNDGKSVCSFKPVEGINEIFLSHEENSKRQEKQKETRKKKKKEINLLKTG